MLPGNLELLLGQMSGAVSEESKIEEGLPACAPGLHITGELRRLSGTFS